MNSYLLPYSSKLDSRLAAHLLSRATFGPSSEEIDAFTDFTADQAVEKLMKSAKDPLPPVDSRTGKPWLPARTKSNSPESSLRRFVTYWWLDQILRQEISLKERMVYFFHTHFTTMQSRANYGSALYYQNQLFRFYALGNFRELATKICLDQAMLMHLDGRYNRNDNPNENFAREFLELYSIGKGAQISSGDYTTYTEYDVKQAARVFSGFQIDESFAENIDPRTAVPFGRMPKRANGEPTLHDFQPKTFSKKFGEYTIKSESKTQDAVIEEIKEFVHLVFNQPETAKNICRKLYRFFVFYQISSVVEKEVIQPLADLLIEQDYELAPVLKTLLCSNHFFDMNPGKESQHIKGTLIKSPLELVSHMIRYFKVSLPSSQNPEEFYTLYGEIFTRMEEMGIQLYEPPDVAGYPAYYQSPDFNRNWISATSLAHRYHFASSLINGIRRRGYDTFFKLDVLEFIKKSRHISDPGDAEKLVRSISEVLYLRDISEDQLNYFIYDVLLDGLSLTTWKMEWEHYKKTGTDSSIRRQIELLFTKMMQTPEYQMF